MIMAAVIMTWADHVGELLAQIQAHLESKQVDSEYRREILDRALPFIENGNAGMDDMLYDVAYAACYDEEDLRCWQRAFEDMKDDWKTSRARRIYRQIGDRDKYLELRLSHMEYGADFHDLATFYGRPMKKKRPYRWLRRGWTRVKEEWMSCGSLSLRGL